MTSNQQKKTAKHTKTLENHYQNKRYLGRFEVEKVRFFVKNALWLYSELCFLLEWGAHFQRIMKTSGQKMKNVSKTMLDTLKNRQNGVGYINMSSK